MTDITPRLDAFWFTPENQPEGEKVRFRLKPLTQPQIVELFETFDGSKATNTTWYRAGEMALNGGREIEGLTIEGKPAAWPRDRDIIPYKYVVACGVEIAMQAWATEPGGAIEKNS